MQSAITELYGDDHGGMQMEIFENSKHSGHLLVEMRLGFAWFWIGRSAASAVALVPFLALCLPERVQAVARPLEEKSLQAWYCANLVTPFDFTKAVKTFPFETLGEISEKKETKPGGKRSADTTSVEQKAKGDTYTVVWQYQYSEDNVTAPYGYMLAVDAPLRLDVDPTKFPKKWLESIGKPVYSVISWEVGYGKKLMPNLPNPAGFGFWDSGRLYAHWFNPDDLELFKSACKKH
jgi:hypothetical protein